jgi:hypothetical protein
MQDGHPITLRTKNSMECNYGGQFKKKYCMLWCVASKHNYLGMHKVFMHNVSLRFFKIQPRALAKQVRWHNTLALLDVKLIQKLTWDNVILDTLNRKEEFQVEKPLTNIQTLKAIFHRKVALNKR